MPSEADTRATRRQLLSAGAAGVAWVALRAAPDAVAADADTTRGAQRVKLETELPNRNVLFREPLPLLVRLRNDTGAAVTVPRLAQMTNDQPLFTVTGPSFAAPFVFTPRSRLPANLSQAALAALPMKTQVLEPGQTLLQRFDLAALVPFTAAGPHAVQVQLNWNGVSLSSDPLRFELAQPRFVSARLMLDDGLQGPNPIRVLGLVDDAGERGLYMALFRELAPDYAAAELMYMLRVGAAEKWADEALPTWTNYPRGDSFIERHGWRGPAAFGIELKTAEQRVRVDAAATSPRIQPALMTRNGQVEVFQWAGDGLALWRFAPPQREAPVPAGQRVWHLPMPAQQAGRAGRGRPPRGDRAVAVLLARSPQGATVTLVESVDDRPRQRQVELRSARLLPDGEPALRVDADGTVHVAVVVAADNALRRLHCVDVRFPADGGAARVDPHEAARDLPTPAVAVAVAYDAAGGTRRRWAALLADGRRQVGGAEALDPPGQRPLLPLQLLVLGPHSYLLTEGPRGALALESVG